MVCIYGIAASGLNLMFGYAGMLSLGNAIFLGVGGYTVGIATQVWHWPVLAGVLAAVIFTAVVSVLLGALLVKLSGHYFGVATLALALAFDSLLFVLPGTGQGSGLTTIPGLRVGFIDITGVIGWYVVAVVVTVLMLVLLSWIVAGKRGRILRLVRHDELAAEVLGVPVFRAKLAAFTIGAVFTGIAGVMLYLSQGLMNPDTVGTLISVQLTMLVVIGGPGYRLGGLVGAFAVLWLQALLNSFGNYELLVYGAALLAVVFYLRPGLEGALLESWHWVLSRRRRPGVVAQESTPGLASSRSAMSWSASQSPAVIDMRSAITVAAGKGLEVRSARRSFGGVNAVNDVSIIVPAGKVTGLIGANGAGKSTLINLISGIEPLDGGSVYLSGEDIGHLSPAERTRHGLVRTFQVPRVVDELSVVENIVLGSEASERPLLRRDAGAEARRFARARSTLSDLGLGHLGERPASSLGTGERKYIEVARAIFSDASVLLLDEPAVGLSGGEVEQLRSWLESMRDAGTAILVIDHNIDFIRELADHVYSMESGQITWDGSPEEMEVPVFHPRLRHSPRASSVQAGETGISL